MFGTETFTTLLASAGDLWLEMSVVFTLLGIVFVAKRGARIAKGILS